ncbi:MAG: DUF222 domain-containing protein, partial [Actinomycetes bacterium]
TVCASLPAADAQYVYSVIDRAARRRVNAAKAAKKAARGGGLDPTDPNDPNGPADSGCDVEVPTLDAVRADLFVQLAARLDHDERTAAGTGADRSDGLGGSRAAPGPYTPQRTIAVIIDLATVLGLAEHPGELPGYGPVPASVARALAADATWVRWITDPVKGTLLDAGRRTYRPSTALREFITARDVYCRFPGCSARADGITTEIDHADPFNHHDPDTGGQTTRAGLGALCKRHHQSKTAGLWSITDSQPDGPCDWISPTGHRYSHHPEQLTDVTNQPDSHLDDHPDGRFDHQVDPVSPDDRAGLPDELSAEDHEGGPPDCDPADLFSDPPPEHWADDRGPPSWWLTEPPDPDMPVELTALEHQLHHALCA